VVSESVSANAVAVHGHFHDDSDLSSWTHPGGLIVPAAVGLGESTGTSLQSVLRAIAIGYVSLHWLGAKERIALALIRRGIRTTPTLGTIGAAAASAAILGLNEEQAINAIGIASSITGGLLEPVRLGSDEWRVQSAHAARGGLLAAQLARQGVLGAATGLEGPKGLMRSLALLDEEPPEWTVGPRVEEALDPDIVAKPFATLGDNMAAAIAAKLAYDAGVDPDRIRAITIRMWREYADYPGTDYRGPFNHTVQALASTVFATCAMLVHGELEYDIALNHRQDPAILRLIDVTAIEPVDEGGPTFGSVEILLEDGSKLTRDASEAPRTLLYHDRNTACDLIEARTVRCGRPVGLGRSVAGMVFEVVDGHSSATIRTVLDRLLLASGR
jgi:2-methylcitrate dehydratase PrpD